ncbi:MAG: hypothetical protein QW780_03190 [Sulfolobales archaeon]
MRKYAKLIAMLMLLSLFSPLAPVSSQTNLFSVESTSFRSSTGGSVYPGSANARLVVGVRYLGAESARSVHGCIDLPAGFSVQYRCVGARDPNGSTTAYVYYGDVVYFSFIVDVDRSVAPASYIAKLNVSARVGASLVSELLEVGVHVSPYPRLQLELSDAYWSPEAYPGTANTNLYIVFRANDIRIDSASVIVELPEGFYPRVARRSIGAVGRYSTFTVVVPGVSLSKNLSPGLYTVLVKVNATAVTDDGVYYDTSSTTQVQVQVSGSPQLLLKLVTSGWVGPRVPYGSKASDYRAIFRLEDSATISSIVATLRLPACARSSNGSSSIVTYVNRPIAYGEVFELLFSGITVECRSTAVAELMLEVLASKDGSEFWVTQTYTVPMTVQSPSIDVRVVASYWSPGPAYPGSSRLSLVLVVENYDYVSLYGSVVKMLSEILEPRESAVSNIAISSFSRSTIVFSGLSIPRTVAPGEYNLEVLLDSLVNSGGTIYAITLEFYVRISVAKPLTPHLEVVNYGWADGKAFGHSIGNILRVHVRNSDPSVTIRSLKASLHLPECFKIDEVSRTLAISTTVAYGSTVALEFKNIDVLCDGGAYRANLIVEVMGEIAGSSFWQDLAYSLVLYVESPTLNVDVLSAGWASGLAYSNSSRLTPYVTLVSYTRESLASAVVYVRPINARLSDGRTETAVAVREPVPYGSSFTVRLPTLEVDNVDGSVKLELLVAALVRYGQSLYNASRKLKVELPLVYENNLVVSWSQVEYGGSPSPLLPTARGVRVSTLITNLRPEPISISRVRTATPQGLIVLGIDGDCLRATLAGGGTCALGIVLQVQDSVEPSTYTLKVEVEYVKIVAGASLYNTEVLSIPLQVEALEDYAPNVRLLEAFWGAQQPMPAFPNSRHVPLTIVFQNLGRYDAVGVSARAESSLLNPVVDSAACATRLPQGGTCSIVLYFDIPASARGFLQLNVSLEYYMTAFGTNARVAKLYLVQLYVEPLEHYGGALLPVSWGWLNNYNVFPNTENTTYVVTVANRIPYSVSGIIAELYLPHGFRGNRGSVSIAYVDGPVRSYSSVNIGFRVSVGNVAPGAYSAVVRLDYVVLSGGPGVRVVAEYKVEVVVVDDSRAVEVVSSSWLEGSVEPGTYGALLNLVVRNNLVDGMTGVFLQLELPKGIFSSLDNTSILRLPPVSQQVIQSLAGAGRLHQTTLIQLLQQASAAPTVYSRGDMISFVAPLNLLVNTTGTYVANATLYYVDSWGTPRYCKFVVPLTILGSTRYIEVYLDGGTLRVSSRFTQAVLRLRNVGSSPAYNVYVTIYPHAQLPVIIASPAVNYVDRVDPDRDAELHLTLVYNPMGVYVTGAQTVVSYGTVPLLVGVIYRDVSGRPKTFNTTLVVVVEPFVELVLRDARAVVSAGTIRASGVVVNYGSATAFRAGVRICMMHTNECAESFIGDIEPGAQRAFSVSLSVQAFVRDVNLTLFYYNAYNELLYFTHRLPVSVTTTPTPATTPAEQLFVTERWVAIAAVAGFLVVVAFMIYKVASSYYKKLKTPSEVISS